MASTTDNDDTRLLSVGISWSRILCVSADGSLSTFGDAVDADSRLDPTASQTPQHSVQVIHICVYTHTHSLSSHH